MQMSFFDGTTPFRIEKPIRLIELFAGIGSQAKALKNVDAIFEHYRICEVDKYAVSSYNAIHGTKFTTSDITTVRGGDLGIVDTEKYCYVLTYSFPCVDLSSAGKGAGMEKGSGTRSGLLWEVERLLTECENLPQVLLMENVPEVVGTKNMPQFAKWIAFLDGLGYKTRWQVLNTKDFGIPQNRARCFAVSVHGDYFYEFPQGLERRLVPSDLIDRTVDNRYFVSEKTKTAIAATLGRYSHLLSEKPISTIVATVASNYRGTVVVYDDYNGEIRTDHSVICCLTTNSGAKAVRNGQKLIINGDVRVLTPLECWRFMGFDDFAFRKAKNALCKYFYNGNDRADSQLYKQAGNSITTSVLMALFGQMLGVDWRSKVDELVDNLKNA